uniref:Expansin-like EG45 domain-containing protein n=1 Tax=Oryza sativa subsp. japonica TaxID=39947 RepID=Q653F0_ORYSJ|nr:hypothetical protein [Oryza sativa Japonica Group]BAD46067.1 hypothetical protein [Oryza sativa Japonica Group]
MAKIAFLLAAALLLGLVSVSQAIQGTATFYTTYNPSACYGNQDNGRMIAAASDGLWAGGKICGTMFTVRTATIDLSREAFAAIANPVAGKVLIDYQQL